MRTQSCVNALGVPAGLTVAILLAEAAWGSPINQRPKPEAPTPTRVVHPEPSLRHATPRYAAELPAACEALLRLLDHPLPPDGLQLEDTPLQDLASWLQTTFGTRVEIDVQAIQDWGLDSDTPLTASIENVSLGSALEQVLRPLDLGIMPAAGRVTITTRERLETNLFVGIYPMPLGSTDLRAMIDIVQSTVAMETWDIVGGQASIRPHDERTLLVISQTSDRHREVLELMRSLDAFGPDEPARDAVRSVPVRVHNLRNPVLAAELSPKRAERGTAPLGPLADHEAKVSVMADRIVVQSVSRPFQIYAGELIRSFDGVDVPAIDQWFP